MQWDLDMHLDNLHTVGSSAYRLYKLLFNSQNGLQHYSCLLVMFGWKKVEYLTQASHASICVSIQRT